MNSAFRYIFNALPVVAAAAALAATRGWIAWVVAAVALCFTALIVYLLEGRHSHRLTEGSDRFAKFYANWYARNGSHYVYCDDLAWLEGNENRAIIDQLRSVGSRAHVWVRDDTSPRATELRSAGVGISKIPNIAEIHVPMSLHVSDGEKRLIIRAKAGYRRQSPRQTISFIETGDKYLATLAHEFFRFCEHVTPTGQGGVSP